MPLTRTSILNTLVSRYAYTSYLEIGLGNGRNFAAIEVERAKKVSVDTNPNHRPDFAMSSDEFFAQNERRFDLVFIDGLHECEQVERDILHALEVLNEGGTIVCHDMNPVQEIHQSRPRKSAFWNGDVWKTWVKLRARADLEMTVLDCDQGCGILRRGSQETIHVDETLLNWEGLVKNRKTWLNLKKPEEFDALLGGQGPGVSSPRGLAVRISPRLYPRPPRIGVVVGTFAAIPYVHLHLELRKRRYPNIPFLIHDDGSPFSQEIGALCDRYPGVQFSRNPRRQRHCIGDLTSYYAGLEWAREMGLDLLVKLSRRFAFKENIFPSLRKLALETQYPTFSSYTTSFDFGFRTECIALSARVWDQPEFVRELALRIEAEQGVFVEGYLHNQARALYERARCPETEAVDARQALGDGKDAYALWPELGTDRCTPQPSHIWHDSAGPSDYAALARELGLQYGEADFQDANMGQGIGQKPMVAWFLHIPKTACSYIVSHCDRIKGIGHASLAPLEIRGRVMTCVRDPMSRVVSAWAWIVKDGPVNQVDAVQREIIRSQCGDDFRKFCQRLPEFSRDERMIHFVSQTRHFDRLQGDFELEIIRFEDLDAELKEFAARHKVEFNPGADRPNSSGHGPVAEYFRDSAAVRAVRQAYAADYERFGDGGSEDEAPT